MENRQAIGYMLVACKNLGFTKEQAMRLLGEMYYMIDVKSGEEAELQGFEWFDNLEEESEKTIFIEKQKTRVTPRRITKLPGNYRSKLSIENEKMIKRLRSM